MTYLARIQPFVQEYAETIAGVLECDVTIVDEDCIRIGGTGPHLKSIGYPVPNGSFFQRILETGKPGVIHDVKKENACRSCVTADKCKELAAMGFPIFMGGRPVGVIGLIAFTARQKRKIVSASPKFWNFLQHISSLLEGKLLLLEANQRLEHQVQETMEFVNRNYSFNTIIGQDPEFISVIRKARQVAKSESTVLIRGESGTGKELLARAIHSDSNRKLKPYIIVNCTSIPETLLESELFGYDGGAFTGARKEGKPGKFELAQHGTIFLDEIGDLPLSLQPKLLRVLQEKTIERIGGNMPQPVDLRVISATNRDLESMVKKGTFREDLYYRLNVIPLFVPPLRKRKEDIPLLLDHFFKKYCRILNKGALALEPSLKNWLISYHWPGNVRELENVVEYMVNMAQTAVICRQDIPEYLAADGPIKEEAAGLSLEERVAEHEKSILRGYISPGSSTEEKMRAAHELKISLATFYRKLAKYNLN